MAVQITTGEYTEVLVANHKSFKSINVVQQLNIEAQAKTEEVRAFNDGGEPLVISTDMGQTTGNIAILKSSSSWFESLVLGNAFDAALISFSLKEAIKRRFAIFANYKDKLSGKVYGSMAAVGCVLNSDGTSEAVNGTLQSTFNVTATSKTSYPYKIVVESVTAALDDTLVVTGVVAGIVTGGKTDDGFDCPFIFDTAAADFDGFNVPATFVGSTITCTGVIATHTYLVAYLVVDA